MGRREELLREEAEGWQELNELIDRMTPEQVRVPGYTPDGWAVRDLMWHVARWSDDTARVLGEMAAGTWDGEDPSLQPGWTERANRRWFEESLRMELGTVRAEWNAARRRLLERFGALDELTPEADEWFDETGPIHYAKHLPDLRAWAQRLSGS